MSAETKIEWRAAVLEARRSTSPSDRATEDRAIEHHVCAAVAPGTTVCAYVPTRLEPGTVDLLDAIRGIAGRVLLPVTGEPGPLQWAEFTGSGHLLPAARGLREPSGPRLDAHELFLADVVFVPALAVDRRGVRLGRGAGYYDRTLHAAGPETRLVTIVRDTELVDHLPEDPHDIRMGWAITPTLGLRSLEE
ncbi:5-formyltetrahydrofolate cyclo-ligase [Rhodococcus sp. NPDC058521]|uniref:5-formyltetrahydrofolate cyclo-ligase n=1 Tax=Rhodococcus sp. NPDC058521 TaxID=3346536 RepID=UPI00364FB296